MKTVRQAPLALKIVAALFIVSGIVAALEVLVSLARHRLSLNFGVLGIFIGLGLLRFRRGWRTCALVLTWLGLIIAPVFAVLVLAGARPIHIKILGQQIGHAHRAEAFFIAAGVFALALWQYRVLTRPDVVQLFDDHAEPRSAPNGGPAMPDGNSTVTGGPPPAT